MYNIIYNAHAQYSLVSTLYTTSYMILKIEIRVNKVFEVNFIDSLINTCKIKRLVLSNRKFLLSLLPLRIALKTMLHMKFLFQL